MTRRFRILLALALPAMSGIGPLLAPHDEVHHDAAAPRHQIATAAAHADEAGHVEGAEGLEWALCSSCLLRLASSAALTPPSFAAEGLAARPVAGVSGPGVERPRFYAFLPTRGPPLG